MSDENTMFISVSGDKRGHEKTPLFRAGMKCPLFVMYRSYCPLTFVCDQ
jgi:hypothetical protein